MDLTTQISEAITAWFRAAAAQLIGPALDAVGHVLFQTPAPTAFPQVTQLWALARDLADALFVVALSVVGILVMSAGGYDTRYTAKVLVPRVALAALIANASLAICSGLTDLDNALVGALLGPVPGAALFTPLRALTTNDGTTAQFAGVAVALVAAALTVMVLAVSFGRGLLLLLLTCLAPLALATQALPKLDIAQLWWRAFTAILFVEVLQAALVAVAAGLLGTTDGAATQGSAIGPGLLVVVILYVLFRLPIAAIQWAIQLPIGHHGPLQVVASTLRGSAR